MSPLLEQLPPSLAANRLYVFLVGPGTGESVVLRLPDDSWCVIDCWQQGKAVLPLTAVLNRYQVKQIRLLALTHPHLDHYKGILELLDHCSVKSLAFVGAPDNRTIPALPRLPDLSGHDASLALHLGRAGATLRNLYDRVASRSVEGIHLESGVVLLDDERCGFRLLCLTPQAQTLQEFFRQADWHHRYLSHANQLSTVLRLDWKQLTLILGGDLPAVGSYGRWEALRGQLSAPRAMKLPHHGSRGSISPVWTEPRPAEGERVWMLTAYQSSNLPRFDDGEGLETILRHEERVMLTARPDHIADRSLDRASIANTSKFVANPNPALFGNVHSATERGEPENCVVGACFDDSGTCLERYCLEGALEVVR